MPDNFALTVALSSATFSSNVELAVIVFSI